MDFTYPLNICFRCNGCGLCCGDTQQKTRHILLVESEVEAISAETHLPIEDFAKETVDNAPYVYEMKKPHEGKCFFLKNSNQCVIYGLRPLICRFYPFELRFNQDSGRHVFNYTLECPALNGGGRMFVKKDFEELFLLAKQRLL